MKIDELYRVSINEHIPDLPPLSDFPTFKAPKDKLPDPDVNIKDMEEPELNYYYNLISSYLAAAEEAAGKYLSKEGYVLGKLEALRHKVFREHFSGKDKGGNSENRNSVIETDKRVEEARDYFFTIKAQRQMMERKVKGISQMAIKFGAERKRRREGRWVGSDPEENMQESF